MTTNPRWESLAQTFLAHYASLFGQVRIHVLHAHLMDHLPPAPGEIVDLGGGGGHQALPLARAGYAVTLIDSSPTMLSEAARLREQEPREVSDRLELVKASSVEAPYLLGKGRFDGVLCHGLLMYLDDPLPLLSTMSALARPGAIISVVGANRHNFAMPAAIRHDWAGVLASFDTDRRKNWLGADIRGDDVDDLGVSFTSVEIDPITWYGVRLFTEGWGRNQPPVDPTADVLAAELEATKRDPYRQFSALFHLLGRRRR